MKNIMKNIIKNTVYNYLLFLLYLSFLLILIFSISCTNNESPTVEEINTQRLLGLWSFESVNIKDSISDFTIKGRSVCNRDSIPAKFQASIQLIDLIFYSKEKMYIDLFCYPSSYIFFNWSFTEDYAFELVNNAEYFRVKIVDIRSNYLEIRILDLPYGPIYKFTKR